MQKNKDVSLSFSLANKNVLSGLPFGSPSLLFKNGVLSPHLPPTAHKMSSFNFQLTKYVLKTRIPDEQKVLKVCFSLGDCNRVMNS